jgi:predicted transcriptional regulator of viral defense system
MINKNTKTMEGLNYKEEKVTLTEMEAQVIDSIKEWGEMEDSHSAHPQDVSDWTGISMNKLRGVIASLEKKGVAYVDEIIQGCGKWVILFEDK